MKPILSTLLLVALALPAEAQYVYLKDGTQHQGTVSLEQQGICLKVKGGEDKRFPFEAIQGISLDDEPLYVTPAQAQGRALNHWLVWTMTGASLVAIALSGAALYREWGTPKPAAL